MGGYQAQNSLNVEPADTPSAAHPHPQFYLMRPDGTFVPMIALDELSPSFRLTGTQLSLSTKDIHEGNMARVSDTVYHPQKYYRVEYLGDDAVVPEPLGDTAVVQVEEHNHHGEQHQTQQLAHHAQGATSMVQAQDSDSGLSQAGSGISDPNAQYSTPPSIDTENHVSPLSILLYLSAANFT